MRDHSAKPNLPQKSTAFQGKFQVYSKQHLETLPQLQKLTPDHRLAMRAVAEVLPFRVNNYLVEELIDWDNVPNDPVFQLTFPQPGMLAREDFGLLCGMLKRNAPAAELAAEVKRIRYSLNPHPAGQKSLNVPHENGQPVAGMQHKYRETVLFFPMAGQTCHAYCTYCFRWPQFVGLDDMKFASKEAAGLVEYLKAHKEVTSVLITGGDPMIMRTQLLRQYVEPLLGPGLEHVASIRFGTKAPAYWPYRFTQGEDADDLMRLIGEIRAAGKDAAIMAHFSVLRELQTEVAQAAVKRLVGAGATVRTQAPLIRHVNDNADNWAQMWRKQVSLGAIPYYMFIERDTGARGYFEVPLWRAYMIFTEAYRQVTGLARTVRGPSMSCTPGKVLISGVAEVKGEKAFVLKMLQGRDPAWVNQVFFARYDQRAAWMDQLKPAFGEQEFFFEEGMRQMLESGEARVWLPTEVDALEETWRMESVEPDHEHDRKRDK
ncbi:MAG: lysine 2,3-aminomutase [Planctomycetota bacterium]|nr:lysine 2,3-aminomutase [Planctomycetota bacterium]